MQTSLHVHDDDEMSIESYKVSGSNVVNIWVNNEEKLAIFLTDKQLDNFINSIDDIKIEFAKAANSKL